MATAKATNTLRKHLPDAAVFFDTTLGLAPVAYEIQKLPQKFFMTFINFSLCEADGFMQCMTGIHKQKYVLVLPQ